MTEKVNKIKSQMNPICKELAELDKADAATTNSGIYITTNGNVYTLEFDFLGNKTFKKIEPGLSTMGYPYIDAKYFSSSKEPIKGNKEIEITINGNMHTKIYGKYLHEMVVYSFGDCKNKKYSKYLPVDHFNQNHLDNRVDNLQVVSTLENIIRWVCATDKSPKSMDMLEKELEKETAGRNEHFKNHLYSETFKRIVNYDSGEFIQYLHYVVPEEGENEENKN